METPLTTTQTSNNARYVLFVLLVVHVNAMWARYMTIYLYAVSDANYDDDTTKNFVSIADATSISISEYGMVVGYGFTSSYVLFNLIMGRSADVYNRKIILFCGIIIWNMACLCIGLSNNFLQLLSSQVFLGIGQSFNMPAAFSIIADVFPAKSLAQANGVYVSGLYVGAGASSLSIIITEAVGWRSASFLVATSGFLLALLVLFTIDEPARTTDPAATPVAVTEADSDPKKNGSAAQNPERDQTYTFRQSLGLLLGEPLFILMIFGGMVRLMGAFTLASYLPDLYSQIYPDYNTTYSYLNAAVASIGGGMSSYLGGYAADRWERAGEKRARLYIPAIGALLAAPMFFMVIAIPNFYASMFFLFVEYLFAECWYGPVISVLQTYLPPRVCGLGVGSFSFCIMISCSFMVHVVGLILDVYTSTTALKRTLIVCVCGMYLASAAIYVIASRFMPELNSGPFEGRSSEREPFVKKGCKELKEDHHEANSRPNNDGPTGGGSSIRKTTK